MKLTPLMGRRALLGMMGAGITGASAMPLWAQEADPTLETQDDMAAAREMVEMVMGDPDAPIELVEYASFTCPHCANFHMNVFPQIRANYIDTGKLRLVYRPVYFDGPGLWADMMARCAPSERYFGIVSMLYEKQSEWARAATGAEVAQNLLAIGRLAGMQDDDMTACMQDEDFARVLIESYQTNATRDNVEGTPSFMVNGEPMGNSAYATFAAMFDEILGG
ncbi:MAG: DsbA family protein [Paracoccaceae bacterium]